MAARPDTRVAYPLNQRVSKRPGQERKLRPGRASFVRGWGQMGWRKTPNLPGQGSIPCAPVGRGGSCLLVLGCRGMWLRFYRVVIARRFGFDPAVAAWICQEPATRNQ